jgi:sigma-B regulation protein RsbU (phosphoserine phosphatase)
LRAITETVADCGEVLTALNRYLCQKDQDVGFVTCFLVKLDVENRTFTYASAGHEAFLVDDQGRPRKLESQGPPVGLFEGTNYQSSLPESISPGSLLVLVTDGILDAQSTSGDFYGSKRLLSELSDLRLHSSRAMVNSLHHAVGEFSNWVPQKDDMTAVVVRAC